MSDQLLLVQEQENAFCENQKQSDNARGRAKEANISIAAFTAAGQLIIQSQDSHQIGQDHILNTVKHITSKATADLQYRRFHAEPSI